MITDAEFAELFDLVADLAGSDRRVYIEVGTSDPDAPEDAPTNSTPLCFHSKLGEVENATNMDYGRKAILLRLDSGEQNRIYIDPAWVTMFEGRSGGVRIWFHDRFYLGLSGLPKRGSR